MVELSDVPTVITDINFNLKSWNREFEKSFNWKKNDKSNLNLKRLLYGDLVESSNGDIVGNLKKYGIWDGIFKRKNKTGISIQYSVTLILFFVGKDQKILHLISKVKSQNAFNNLIHTAEFISSFLISFPYGLYVYNYKKRNLTLLNDYLLLTLGYKNSPKRKIDIPFKSIMEDLSNKLLTKGFKSLLKSADQNPVRTVIKIKDKDNTWKDFQNYITILKKDSHNKPIIILGLLENKKEIPRLEDISEERLCGIYKNVAVGIYRTTPNGKILASNDAFAKIAGYNSSSELEKLNLEQNNIFPGYPRRAFKKLLESKDVIEGFETSWTRSDGSTGYLRENARIIRDANGKTKYYEGIIEDITQRRLVDEKLNYAAESYRSLLNNVAEAVFIVNAKGRLIDVNEGAVKLLGCSKEYFYNKSLISFLVVSEEKRSWVKQKLKKTIAGVPQEFETVIKGTSGKLINRNIRLFRFNYFGNEAVAAVTYDITNQKLSKLALQESEESYKSLIDSSLDAIFVLKGRRLLLVNQAWLEMFGYKEKEILNGASDIMQIVAPSSRSIMADHFNKCSDKNIVKSVFEIQGITKKGEILDLEVSITAVKWKGESAYQGVYRNITERKRAEEILKVKDNLLEGVAKATFQLLTQSNIDSAIHSAFDIIGKAINVSRVYIFENYMDPNTNEHLATKIFNWTDDSFFKDLHKPQLKYLSYKNFPGWYGRLSSGSVVKGLVRNFPDSIKNILQTENILSILIIPIFVNNKFWGIIGFGECKIERIWTDAETSILITAGNSFGNALVRKITEQALVESEERYRSLFDQAADLIAMVDMRGCIINLNKKVEVETGWKCEELIGKNIQSLGLLTETSIRALTEHFKRGDIKRIFEIDIIRKDGIAVPYELNIVPINKNGKLTSIQVILRNIKERKENEESLKKSEEKYRKIFENIQDIFYQTDIYGKLTTISPSIERYSGYKPEELIGKPVVSFFSTPGDRARLMKEMQTKSEVVDYIVMLRNRTNKNVFVSVNSHILRNDFGEIIGVEGSLRDVTERELAYDEIRKLSRAVEQSPNTVIITDTSGIIVYVNPKFTDVTGYSMNESIGKNINILKSGKMEAEQYRILWETILSGKEWKGEFHNKKKNGELFWESASISPVKNEKGEITHFLAVKEDITEKKVQEKRLHKYQDLLKGVSESVQILISEKDFHKALQNALEALGKGSGADRVYLFENVAVFSKNSPPMNLKFEWHREGTSSILSSKYMQNITYSNSVSALLQNIEENKSFNALAKQLSEEEQAILKPHGTLSLLIVPIYVDKQFWGFIGFDDCHSEEVWSESEESILSAAAASIGRAIEREKTNAELIRAKEEAEKAERLKSEFLAQISHEIRSPLNVLLNYSQLFKELVGDKIESELFQGFDGMENAGNRIIRTIDLLLNLSELQTGSYNFKSRELDIYSGIIFPLFQEYKKIARGKNLIFNIIRHIDNTKVIGDEYSITQIFANLIDNAIKYTNDGKIELSIDRNFNNKLVVKVIDSGIGISEYYLPKIYSPFTQEEQGYTRSYEGNGLGLALVKKYCELNKAEIFIDSVKGKGTTFTIVFN